MSKAVSIIIVTWNSAKDIEQCLNGIAGTGYGDKEIIVMDNASTDFTPDIIRTAYREVRLIENKENLGFAAALNNGIAIAGGELILSLNPDSFLMPGTLGLLVEAICAKDEHAAAAPKMLKKDGKIDCAGIEERKPFVFANRGEEDEDRGQYDREQTVFGATGACALYKKSMLADIAVEGEMFDEDFFAYKEDVDVSIRAGRRGWKTIYVPAAVCLHDRSIRGISQDTGKTTAAKYIEWLKWLIKARRASHYRAIKTLSFRNNVYLYLKHYRLGADIGQWARLIYRIAKGGMYYLCFEPYVFGISGDILRKWGKMAHKRRKIRQAHKEHII